MKTDKKVELLAPAGSIEGFYGAIHAGADAVYLGGSKFGARAYAENFTTEELVQCIRYAHLWERKVYLTVNTLVKENEFSELHDYLLPFYEAGLDGVIVQDIGVFSYIGEHFPDMELHVSTQMTLTGKYGAELLKQMGACRVVPARELSLQEIRQMKEETGLEIECFIHGAMCYCYSGQCLFSSILGGRSGNRGRCAQPCRLPYQVEQDGTVSDVCYPLSLKDMCTIEHIPELIQAGIDSFKIEGRMKKPEYAAGVTAIYRKYIDFYYENPEQPLKVSREDLEALSSLYIRSERQDGYYYKHNGRDMVTLHNPAYGGTSDELLMQIRQNWLEKSPRKAAMLEGTFVVGQPASVKLTCEGYTAFISADIVEPAQKQPITRENVEKQLGKLGDSIFSLSTLDINISENAFFPLKKINELRRAAVAQMEELLLSNRTNPRVVDCDAELRKSRSVLPEGNAQKDSGKLHVSVRTMEQLQTLYEWTISQGKKAPARIYLDGDLLLDYDLIMETHCNALAAVTELVIALPYIIREKDSDYLDTLLSLATEERSCFKGFLIRSLDGLGYLQKKGYQGAIYGDAGVYIWNLESMRVFCRYLTGFCMPLELKGGEQRGLTGQSLPCEKIVYGRIPMMITANCVAKTMKNCKKSGQEAVLIDRYQKRFPVALNCRHCMNVIYNSVPLSLHGEMDKWRDKTNFRLDFTMENKTEMFIVLNYFTKLEANSSGETANPPYQEYTTGHEKRGVL